MTTINLLAVVCFLFALALFAVAFKVRELDKELARTRLELITLNSSVSVLNSKLALVSARLESIERQGAYYGWRLV